MAKIDVVIYDGLTNPPPDSPLVCEDESRAVQDAKDECDINMIMARYQKMGVLPPGVGVGTYGDFSTIGDFQEAQEIILRAQQQFDALPSKAREKFKNNPGAMLEWLADASNLDEAVSLGLLVKEKKVDDAQVSVAAAGGAAPTTG